MDSVTAAGNSPDVETSGPDTTRLKQGDTVAGRFVVDECLRTDVLGPTWRAVDQKSGKRVEILILTPEAAEERPATERLRGAVKVATKLVHKNVVGSFGMGREGTRRYLVREFVDGQTLADLLDKKARSGKTFSLKGAYNLIAHVCNALAAAAPDGPHGTLRPSSVLINRTGRVKVGDFGLGELHAFMLSRRDALPTWDRTALTRAQGDDAVAVGVLLFSLLTGRPPREDEYGLPADARTAEDDAVDAVLRRTLDVRHPQRLNDPAAIKTALSAALPADRGEAGDDVGGQSTELQSDSVGVPGGSDLGADEGEDVLTSSAPVDAPARPARVEPKTEPAAKGKKAPAAFVIPDLRKPGEVDDDGTARRWLVERNGTDYGPYTRKEIVDKLFVEEITPQTVIYDVETDHRIALAEFAAFEQVLVTWTHEKAERERRRAEDAALASARRRTRVLGGIAAVIVLGVGGTAGGFAWYKSTLPEPVKAFLPAMITQIQGALPSVTLPEEVPETEAEIRERREKEAADKASAARRNELAARSREANLAAATEINAVNAGSGDGVFDRGDLDRQLGSRQGGLIRCLQDEVKRNPGLKSATVKGTVIPLGSLINVSLDGGSDRATTCVRGALKGIKVAPFDGGNQSFSQPFNFE